ncbi:2EXR domain-containing protein [Fusarium sp. LHS14.1]|nr:2EXR domain-containing protein [Fusarium sp. LHS14.1]
MVSSVFHPFPRLPTELRLQIWENACLPSQDQRRGLHYFNLDHDKKLVSLGWNHGNSPELQGPAGQAKRSAYLWHGGLWTACKESRGVVMKPCQLKEWGDLIEQAEREDKRAGNYKRMAAISRSVVGDEGVPPGMVVMREGHKEWYFIVYPTRDIFCVTSDNWESFLRSWSMWDAEYYLPIACNVLHSLYVENIAFEFDPSWNHDFPTCIYDLMEEKSARGCLAKMVEFMVSSNSFSRFKIWLVDQTARWRAKPDQVVGPVFRDCDGEYVQIEAYYTYNELDKGESRSPLLKFIHEFGYLGDSYYRDVERGDWSPGLDYILDHPYYWADSSIGLLVRRDKYVTDEEYFWVDLEDEGGDVGS